MVASITSDVIKLQDRLPFAAFVEGGVNSRSKRFSAVVRSMNDLSNELFSLPDALFSYIDSSMSMLRHPGIGIGKERKCQKLECMTTLI